MPFPPFSLQKKRNDGPWSLAALTDGLGGKQGENNTSDSSVFLHFWKVEILGPIPLQRFIMGMISLAAFPCNTDHKVPSERNPMLKTLHNNFHRPLSFKAEAWEFVTKRPSYKQQILSSERYFPPQALFAAKSDSWLCLYVPIRAGSAWHWPLLQWHKEESCRKGLGRLLFSFHGKLNM